MKPSLVTEALEIAIKADRPVFLWGPPGVGKSDVVAQVATQLKRSLVDVRAVLLDPVDLRGIPSVEDDEKSGERFARWCVPAFLPRGKGKFLLFLDELNAAPPLVQAAAYQLVLNRKLGEYQLPKDCVIIAAGNRETDRAVTSRMPSPLANRFLHMAFDVDLQDWTDWAIGHDIRTEIIAFLRFRPELLHKFDPKRNEKAFPTPRTWEFTSDILKASNGSGVEYELITGTVGEGAATELMGFLNIYRKLPDPDAILMNPQKADVPDDPATLYAICGALAAKASGQTIGRIVEYANRLPVEFSVLLVRDCVKHDSSVVKTRSFIEWTSHHSDVLI